MKRNIFIAILTVSLVIISIASQSLALTDAQEEKYRKARILLKEGKTSEAKYIFTALSMEESSDPRIRLGLIDTTIGEAVILRAGNQSTWKYKIQEAFSQLKGMYRTNIASPDMYLSFARCYTMNDRPQKADKSLRKALYYRPDYIEAIIAKGDIYFEKSKRVEVDPLNESSGADKSDQERRSAIKYYNEALSRSDLDAGSKAMLNYRIAEVFSYHGYRKNEIEHLNKVIELLPDSYWGNESRMRLSKLQSKK